MCSVGYFCVQVSCYCRYLVIGVYAFCSISTVAGINLRSHPPLIFESGGWAHVEGDLRCPSPPDLERERNQRSALGL